jgi:hypothetical protein
MSQLSLKCPNCHHKTNYNEPRPAILSHYLTLSPKIIIIHLWRKGWAEALGDMAVNLNWSHLPLHNYHFTCRKLQCGGSRP